MLGCEDTLLRLLGVVLDFRGVCSLVNWPALLNLAE